MQQYDEQNILLDFNKNENGYKKYIEKARNKEISK